MGFFSWIKNLFIKGEKLNNSGVVSFNNGGFNYLDNSKAFNSTYVNTAFRLSVHAAKQALSVINSKTSNTKHNYLIRKLNFKPNPLQTAFSMWQSFYYDHFFGGIGMIYIEWDYESIPMRVKNFWPISSADITRTKVYESNLYIEFKLNGNLKSDIIDNFIVLVRKPTSEDMLNATDPSLKQVLDVLATNNQGIVEAINNSNAIRFIVSSPAKMNDKMKTDNQAKFEERVKNADQVLYIDGAEHIVQVNNQGKYVETQGVESYRKEIFRSFGVNEKFLDSSFTENDWQAIHEGVFEALQLALQQELTNKIFTSREFEYGNRIITEVNKLQTASLSTRIKIAEIYEKLPVIRPNTVCELLYLPSLEDGDKEVQSLNFVESGKANTYQGVGDDNDDKPKNDKKEGEEDA